jgi:ribonuclease HIII
MLAQSDDWLYAIPPMPSNEPSAYQLVLDAGDQARLIAELRGGNYRDLSVPHTLAAAERPGCRICLYRSGKCTVQGKGASEWVRFVLEPGILRRTLDEPAGVAPSQAVQPHMGVDESGKGDFFGPLVIAAAYVDEQLAPAFQKLKVRDSKLLSNDTTACAMAAELRRLLGRRCAVISIGPRAYNRLYTSMKSVNRILAWGHARAIENLLESVPDCPRAVADQFGPEQQIQRALLQKGRKIELEQRPRAESDPAVAAASILARAGFLEALHRLGETSGLDLPKGASPAVRAAAEKLIRSKGPAFLLETAKCHFKTADQVLTACGAARADLGPDGQAVSKSARPDRPRSTEKFL